jgi:hypothetical protein
LRPALAALLFQHAPGQEQRPYERFPQGDPNTAGAFVPTFNIAAFL